MTLPAQADVPASLVIDLTKPGPAIPSTFYGLMTEEINHSYDGGLYAELIQNRAFQDNAQTPTHWSVVQDGGGQGTITLDTSQPLSPALPVSLRLDISRAGGRVGAANDGYWGVPVKPQTVYHASFYARAAPGFTGPLTLSLESADGSRSYAEGRVSRLTDGWERYAVTLKTGRVTPSADSRFVISAKSPGTVWLTLVSLFPPTYKDRPDGFRPDLMEKMAAMRPAFLRMPGGNYVEGNTVAERFDWKKTVGPWTGRPGHPSPWGYRSSDGMGLLEFLEWCEDLKMEPVLAVYAGYSLRGEHVTPGPDLQPYVQDALDEIEYVTGDETTKWGAERARDGHPRPFPLAYVEIGNEDGFDKSGSYDARFAQFYDAIKAKYPRLQLIATAGGKDPIGQRFPMTLRTPDVIDEHYYQSAEQMERDAHRYDTYDRKGPKIFVGEWASFDKVAPWEPAARQGGPTSSFLSALGDAAWLTGLERNSDVVIMEAYAPLLVNVNPGARQWTVNLIGYDALTSYGSPSYYVQTMFGQNHGDVVVPVALTGSQLFESVTRDTKTGRLYVKLVNTADSAQPVHITLNGARSVSATGTSLTLSSPGLTDVNTLTDPTKIVPVAAPVSGISRDFTYTAAANSVTVLQMQAKG
jgi:alpha-N-arabinofuranosidase